MNRPTFEAPALVAMNGLLPAFEFQALIASTPHGAVYMARQRSLDRNVAIKILAQEISANANFRRSFETTARAMAKLNHPNLIGVYDSGFVDGMLYFVMEFVPGKSLEHSSRDHQVELTQALKLIESICAGLAHAHDHGITHGNLHPSNILLNQKAEPKIGNFGFSHPGGSTEVQDPVTSSYVAPELAAGAQANPAADVYAVGATLYRLLTAQRHATGAQPPSGITGCPPEIDAVWLKATDPDPGRRFTSVRELVKALHAPPATSKIPLMKSAAAGIKLVPASPPPQAGATPPETGPQSPPKTQKVHKIGFNWKLLRNLVIIAGLLYAIKIAWEFREQRAAEVARRNQAAATKAEAEKQRMLEEARNRPLSKRPPNGSTTPGSGTEITPPPPLQETPEESLDRLRAALAGGDRSEMPKDSVRRGDSDYLLISKALAWTDAAWFAEQHGAHLCIPNASADLTWLVTEIAKGTPVWIGAGRSGRSSWTLADGTPWAPKKEPTGLGLYLSADKHGLLRAAGAGEKLPFILQWRRDGSNPAALETILAATAKTIAVGNPVFPPGTRAFENRFYLPVSRDMNWRAAADIAAASGGHLAVVSDISEATNIDSLTAELPASKRLWIGGFIRNGAWLWITGEPWKTAKWATDANSQLENGGLLIRPKAGWDTADISDEVPGFIIEWSNDRKGSSPSSTGNPAAPAPANTDVAALTARAKELIAAADRKRTEQLGANARKFAWDLDVVLRGMTRGDQSIWGTHIARLKTSVINNRVPATTPGTSGILLNPKMLEIAQYASTKQASIDSEFAAEAERVRIAFVTKIKELVTKAQQAGQTPLATSLGETLNSATSLETWVSSLGAVLRPGSPVPRGDDEGEATSEGDDGAGLQGTDRESTPGGRPQVE